MTTVSMINADAVERPAPQSNDARPQGDALHIVHVTSSRFFGGPERQMLELAVELAPEIKSSFISFAEGGLCEDFLGRVRTAGFAGTQLKHDTPHLARASRELCRALAHMRPSVICSHGYKSNLLGLYAARRLSVPIVSVSHGWTGESLKVRAYEWLDRRFLPRMDAVVAVSDAQARKIAVRTSGRATAVVIRDAVNIERYDSVDASYRLRLEEMFPTPPSLIVGAAGRLSPEKGFDILVAACQKMDHRDFGVVLFGNGVLRQELQNRIDEARLGDRFLLAGFTSELDKFMPHFDLFVQSSHTEGLPNVLLEAGAAGVPVVATDVGGTSELVVDGETGLLVAANDPEALRQGISRLLVDSPTRQRLGQGARERVMRDFAFRNHAAAFRAVFEGVLQ